MAEIPIAMILLSRVLKPGVNRWVNIIAGIVTIPVVVSTAGDSDDIIFAAMEIVALIAIIWLAWKWAKQGT